jgi:hypothetical protein
MMEFHCPYRQNHKIFPWSIGCTSPAVCTNFTCLIPPYDQYSVTSATYSLQQSEVDARPDQEKLLNKIRRGPRPNRRNASLTGLNAREPISRPKSHIILAVAVKCQKQRPIRYRCICLGTSFPMNKLQITTCVSERRARLGSMFSSCLCTFRAEREPVGSLCAKSSADRAASDLFGSNPTAHIQSQRKPVIPSDSFV